MDESIQKPFIPWSGTVELSFDLINIFNPYSGGFGEMKFNRVSILMSLIVFGMIFGLSGCGGGNTSSKASATSVKLPEDDPTFSGQVHIVKMKGDHTGFYFEPAELTIKPGDKVVWKMISGGPHNVLFEDQGLPEGARSVLKGNNKLASDYYSAPGTTYEIHFTKDYPPGEYKYICVPHVSAGMRGVIRVKKRK